MSSSVISKKSTSKQHGRPNPRNTSCSQCRKAKKKCDQATPKCSLCASKNKDCKYSVEEERKPLTKSYVNTLVNRIDKLEEALSYYKHESSNKKSNTREGGDPILTPELTTGSPASDFFYKDIFNNLLSLNSSIGEPRPGNNALDHPYPLSTSLGFALPTSTLKHCSNFSLSLKVPLFDNWGFSFAGKGAPLYSGFTSMRFAKNPKPIYNTTTSNTTKKLLRRSSDSSSLGGYYIQIFDWFFERIDNTIPLIDKGLFFGSIESSLDHEALEIGEDQHASISLVNSIVAYYFLIKDDSTTNFDYFYNLAQQQVNEETKDVPQLKTIQTLLLLSLIDMTRGNEIGASELVARAVAVSYHLGLHMDSRGFAARNLMNEEEVHQRELIFWCCFIIDKLRASILGISPFVHCPEISIKLPCSIPESEEDISKKIQNDILMETITFADTQCETLNVLSFDLRDLYFAEEKDEKSEYVKIGLAVSKASLTLSEWRRNMIKHTMYSSTKTTPAAYLEVLFNTSRIVIHKQLVKEPMRLSDLDARDQSPIMICTTSAETILKVCEAQTDLSLSLFGYHFVYTIYMASLIFLFNTSSEDEPIKTVQRDYLQRAVNLLETNKKNIHVAEMYLSHLQKFCDEWN